MLFDVVGGSAQVSDTVQVTLGEVVNPAAAGLGPGFTLELRRASEVIDNGAAPGSEFTQSEVIISTGFEGASP